MTEFYRRFAPATYNELVKSNGFSYQNLPEPDSWMECLSSVCARKVEGHYSVDCAPLFDLFSLTTCMESYTDDESDDE